jgi:2-polyprenyl-3-methyl-5-hydroxy-6-metoxy-1,4-benzoquinol methylase
MEAESATSQFEIYRMSDHTHHEYYDKKWSEVAQLNQIPTDEERASLIVELLVQGLDNASNKVRRILDVGCGVGWLTLHLLPFGDVTGVDSSQAAIDLANEACAGARFLRIDMLDTEQVSNLGVYDAVVCSEVFEHVPNEQKAAFAIALARLVRPGGILVLTTPNRLVWKRYWLDPITERWRQPVEDWCTPASLRHLFSQLFKCQVCHTFNFGFTYEGIYRVLNSVKLNRLLRLLGLARWWNSIFKRTHGLYIAARFKRV